MLWSGSVKLLPLSVSRVMILICLLCFCFVCHDPYLHSLFLFCVSWSWSAFSVSVSSVRSGCVTLLSLFVSRVMILICILCFFFLRVVILICNTAFSVSVSRAMIRICKTTFSVSVLRAMIRMCIRCRLCGDPLLFTFSSIEMHLMRAHADITIKDYKVRPLMLHISWYVVPGTQTFICFSDWRVKLCLFYSVYQRCIMEKCAMPWSQTNITGIIYWLLKALSP